MVVCNEKICVFHNTLAPVVNWSTVRLLNMMDEMDVWESRKIDYVIAFPQAPIDSDVYPHLPAVFHVDGKEKNIHISQSLRRIYI